jgi:hypothetical protein
MKLFVRGNPNEVQTFFQELSAHRQYEVIAHYQEKDHFHQGQIRVGATVQMEKKPRESLLVTMKTDEGKEIELKLLDGRVIEMDGHTLVFGRVYDVFA